MNKMMLRALMLVSTVATVQSAATCADIAGDSTNAPFVCSAGSTLKSSPETITCVNTVTCADNSDSAQNTACCNANAVCSTMTCAAGFTADSTATGTACAAAVCDNTGTDNALCCNEVTSEPEPEAPAPSSSTKAEPEPEDLGNTGKSLTAATACAAVVGLMVGLLM